MYIELKELLYSAEDHYLQPGEIAQLRSHLDALKERLAIYKIVRNEEIGILQAIADQLEAELSPDLRPALEKAIVHWASVLRYSAMAMLLNSPEFLQRRLLEWLTPVIKAHQPMPVENRVYELLRSYLKQNLAQEQWNLLYPFLEQAQVVVLA